MNHFNDWLIDWAVSHLLLSRSFTSTETTRLIRDGRAKSQDSASVINRNFWREKKSPKRMEPTSAFLGTWGHPQGHGNPYIDSEAWEYRLRRRRQNLSPLITLDHTPSIASLSGTFLQTLAELVSPLKGTHLYLRVAACPPTLSVPSERFGY